MYAYFNVSETNYLDYLERQRKGGSQAGGGVANPKQTQAVAEGKQPPDYPIELGLTAESGYPHEGTIDFVDNTVDPNSGTILVRGTFKNPPPYYLAPGLFVRLRVPVRKDEESMVVPDKAIGTDQAGTYLLVVRKDNTVERREVTPGEQVGDKRVIEKGLEWNERFVVEGLQRARPGEKVAPENHSPPRKLRRIRPPPLSERMLSRFFIERPIFANVIAVVTMIFGAVAVKNLPVEQYPQITPPTVQVTTTYPGANATVVANTVADPIEQQVNGVEHMLYMSSNSSSDGSYNLTVTFDVGTDVDIAQVLVQNRVQIAVPLLPLEVQQQGLVTKKQSTDIVLFVVLTSPGGEYDSLFLSNFATINVLDELSRLPGVGNINVVGSANYSMRLWLDPEKLKARNLTTEDVVSAIEEQNVQVAAGQIGQPPAPKDQTFQYTITTLGRLTDPNQFANIIVKTTPGPAAQITRVKDVARVELVRRLTISSFASTASPPRVWRSISSRGRTRWMSPIGSGAKMEELKSRLPKGVTYAIPFDTTLFVSAAISEVYWTLSRSRRPGADRDPGVSPRLAGRAGSRHNGAGDDRRRLRGHVCLWLYR